MTASQVLGYAKKRDMSRNKYVVEAIKFYEEKKGRVDYLEECKEAFYFLYDFFMWIYKNAGKLIKNKQALILYNTRLGNVDEDKLGKLRSNGVKEEVE